MLDPIAGPFCPVLTNNSSPLNRLRLAWDIGRLLLMISLLLAVLFFVDVSLRSRATF